MQSPSPPPRSDPPKHANRRPSIPPTHAQSATSSKEGQILHLGAGPIHPIAPKENCRVSAVNARNP